MTEHAIVCPVCASEETKPVVVTRRVNADDGVELQFTVELTECTKCGEQFYTRAQSLASSRSSAAALRAHEGLLPPDRIRAIRESYMMTQAEFEQALRLGPKTVVRWESGTVRQSAIANTLLLAIENNWQTFSRIAEANGVTPKGFVWYQNGVFASEVRSATASTGLPRREPIEFPTFARAKKVGTR